LEKFNSFRLKSFPYFIYSSQAGDSNSSVFNNTKKGYEMADNEKMILTKASLDQTKAAMAKANSTMATAKASAKANLAQQKANVMLGEIKKATG